MRLQQQVVRNLSFMSVMVEIRNSEFCLGHSMLVFQKKKEEGTLMVCKSMVSVLIPVSRPVLLKKRK